MIAVRLRAATPPLTPMSSCFWSAGPQMRSRTLRLNERFAQTKLGGLPAGSAMLRSGWMRLGGAMEWREGGSVGGEAPSASRHT